MHRIQRASMRQQKINSSTNESFDSKMVNHSKQNKRKKRKKNQQSHTILSSFLQWIRNFRIKGRHAVKSLRKASLASKEYDENIIATDKLSVQDVDAPKIAHSGRWPKILALLALLIGFFFMSRPAIYNAEDIQKHVLESIPQQLQELTSQLLADERRPGLSAAQSGLESHFPVVIVPGLVSTALEVWAGGECAKNMFRRRLYGSTLMIRSILLDSKCWIQHMLLDNQTGLDPPGIKVRAASGFEASDFLFGNYWLWAKMIQGLADVGYDSNSLYIAPYDWRLSFNHLQLRDFYFTKLQRMIELAYASNHCRKVVILSHSMGSLVQLYFMKWVTSSVGGNGGVDWVDRYVSKVISIAGPMLGVPKSYSALLSGEMKDTAELMPLVDWIRQRAILDQRETRDMIRNFRSMPSMYPKGGDAVWGDLKDGAPDDMCKVDDSPNTNHASSTSFFTRVGHHFDNGKCRALFKSTADHARGGFVSLKTSANQTQRTQLSLESAFELIQKEAPHYTETMRTLYSWGHSPLGNRSEHDQRFWANPLETTLPHAPKLEIYCLYGVGRATERAYMYHEIPGGNPGYSIDTDFNDESVGIRKGVKYIDGDGTVPLLSTGFPCKLWQNHRYYNPSGSHVVIREFRDPSNNLSNTTSTLESIQQALNSGLSTITRPADSVDHVDILGNFDLILDVLRIVGKVNKPSIKENRFCTVHDRPHDWKLTSEETAATSSNLINRDDDRIDRESTFFSQDSTSSECLEKDTSDSENDEYIDDSLAHHRRWHGEGFQDSRNCMESGHYNADDSNLFPENEEAADIKYAELANRYALEKNSLQNPLPRSRNNDTRWHWQIKDRIFTCIDEITELISKRLQVPVKDFPEQLDAKI